MVSKLKQTRYFYEIKPLGSRCFETHDSQFSIKSHKKNKKLPDQF